MVGRNGRCASARLDRIQGQIGGHEQIFGIGTVERPDGMPNADAGSDAMAVDLIRMADRFSEPFCKPSSACAGTRRLHDDGELIAAQPRQEIIGLATPFATVLRRPAAAGRRSVPERVVDHLETVEVEEQDGKLQSAPSAGVDTGSQHS